MPPKKKAGNDDKDDEFMRAARFGRVKNTLTMGFVGLPNVGKSSLTNLLAGANHAEAANYVSQSVVSRPFTPYLMYLMQFLCTCAYTFSSFTLYTYVYT